jgi:hypothetical protein
VEAADGGLVDEDVAVGVPPHRHRRVLLFRRASVAPGQLRRGRVEVDVLDDDPALGHRERGHRGGVAVPLDRGLHVAWHISLRGAEGEGDGSRGQALRAAETLEWSRMGWDGSARAVEFIRSRNG